jgi:hypothetical protein
LGEWMVKKFLTKINISKNQKHGLHMVYTFSGFLILYN